MEIHSIGYHHYHDKDFVIDRPDGIGQSWLFLVFKTRTIVRQNGVDTVVLPIPVSYIPVMSLNITKLMMKHILTIGFILQLKSLTYSYSESLRCR